MADLDEDDGEDGERLRPLTRARELFGSGEYEAAGDAYSIQASRDLGECGHIRSRFDPKIAGNVAFCYIWYLGAVLSYRHAGRPKRSERRAREATLVFEDLRDDAFEYVIQRAACEEYIADLRAAAGLPYAERHYRRAAAGYGMAAPGSHMGWRFEDCLHVGEQAAVTLAETADISTRQGDDLYEYPEGIGFFEARGRWKRDNISELVHAYLEADDPKPL